MTIQECGMSDAVLQTLARYMERATDDIKASSLLFPYDSLMSCMRKVYLVPFSISSTRSDVKK